MRGNGYAVPEAPDGHQALQTAQDHTGRIDLLITDIVMPRMSGTELATEIRKMRGDMPVLFITGYAERVPKFAELIGESERLLTKPFLPEKLAQAVRSLLDSAKKASPKESA
jgi:CheY-like chemotaxis protein